MLSLWNALGIPPTRVPIDLTVFISYILPPLFCSLVVAALATVPKTRPIRVALWPTFALLSLRAVASVDVTGGNPGRAVTNAYFACATINIVARTLEWTLAKEPLVRYLRPENNIFSVVTNALDLMTNFRGYGWNWSHGFLFPQDTRPKDRIAFALCTFLSAVVHILVFGTFQRASLSFRSPECTTVGFTIFDDTLPIFLRYLRAGIFVAMQFIASYNSSQAGYNLSATLGVLVFGQEPAQWPPAFDAPWRATSVRDFWGRRWHQWFRRIFLFIGGRPLSLLLGPVGNVLGGFLASAVMHAIMVTAIGSGEDALSVFFSFVNTALVALVEFAFHWWTGKRVGGMLGWIWTMTWLLVLNTAMFDGWAKAGGLGASTVIDSVWPVRLLVERLVKGLDAWLHAI